MNDACTMRVRERPEELDGERGGDLGRQRPCRLEELPKCLPADELDDEVLLVFVGR